MPPKQLEMSLKHVNKLLAQIDDGIVLERKLISQIDNGSDIDTDTHNRESQETKTTKLVYKSVLTTYQDSFNRISDIQAARQLINLWKMSKVGRTVPELLPPEPLEDDIFTTPTTSTKAVNKLDETDAKQGMLLYMKKHNVSYCLGAVFGLVDILGDKTPEDIEVFASGLSVTLKRLDKQGKLNCLDGFLKRRILRLGLWTRLVAPIYIRRYIINVYKGLHKGYFLEEESKETLLTYDSLFTDQEGDQLLDSVVVFAAYDIRKGLNKNEADKLWENWIMKFIAPIHRLCATHSFRLKALINEINVAYSKYYPSSERKFATDLSVGNLLTNKVLLRPKCKDSKDIKCHRRYLNHGLVKYPAMFQEITEQYKYTLKNNDTKPVKSTLKHNNYTHKNINKIFDKKYTKEIIQKLSKTENYLKGYSINETVNISLNDSNGFQKHFASIQRPLQDNNRNLNDRLSFTEHTINNYIRNYSIPFQITSHTISQNNYIPLRKHTNDLYEIT